MPAAMDLIGHAPQRAQLMDDLASGNLAHAYLFAGDPHVGKMTVARWFAEEVLLQNIDPPKQEEERARLRRLMHPDLLVLDKLWMDDVQDDWAEIARYSNVPQEHRAKTPKAKTDVIGIDEVRALKQRLYETGEGPRRVCIIRSVERMQDAAVNALLKMLEEPPPGRIFLLTTHALESLLPTIRSRTRILRFSCVTDAEISSGLPDIGEEEKRFILSASQGAPGTALRLARDPDALAQERLLRDQALSVWSAPHSFERMQALKPLKEKGALSDRLLLHLFLTLRAHPARTRRQDRALFTLAKRLHTNASRELLLHDFALEAGEKKSA